MEDIEKRVRHLEAMVLMLGAAVTAIDSDEEGREETRGRIMSSFRQSMDTFSDSVEDPNARH